MNENTMNRRRFLWTTGLGLAGAALTGRAAQNNNRAPSGASGRRMVARPKDTGRALENPQMGWQFHYYSNIPTNYGSKLAPSNTLDYFPGLTTIYLRLPWSYVEPEEGRFTWSVVDPVLFTVTLR